MNSQLVCIDLHMAFGRQQNANVRDRGVGERSDAPDVTAAEINKLREWEANHALTVLYLIVEASRNQNDLIEREKLRRSISTSRLSCERPL